MAVTAPPESGKQSRKTVSDTYILRRYDESWGYATAPIAQETGWVKHAYLPYHEVRPGDFVPGLGNAVRVAHIGDAVVIDYDKGGEDLEQVTHDDQRGEYMGVWRHPANNIYVINEEDDPF